MTEQGSTPMEFGNGLTDEQDDELDELQIALVKLAERVENLGRHRSYALAITKIDEARHWLRDRKGRPA